jgi:hypothetical protein
VQRTVDLSVPVGEPMADHVARTLAFIIVRQVLDLVGLG